MRGERWLNIGQVRGFRGKEGREVGGVEREGFPKGVEKRGGEKKSPIY